ncbi:signal transduction histidine kinase [Maribacter vaceletii]|uniref:histidine kinase n=1 Tax=Maribacter vaceletii TaxID=1206816 RepID=A0A495DUH2_9FLAO|nr:sensor histidine kinase [Maribacter vaceletii]RKR07819.1 signal transduction histidine kinase [Maribacter vaceletii]
MRNKKLKIGIYIYIKRLLFVCVHLCFITINGQDGTANKNQMVNFSWSKRSPEKSLQPFYELLKTTEYGAQRFSVIEQLIEHHTKKSNTDSILHYGNLYIKEIGNWNQTEHIKLRHYSKAHYYLGTGSLMNGLTDNAIKWYIQGLQESEESNFKEYNYKNKLGLSKSYIYQLKLDKAIKILRKSLKEFSPEFPSLKIRNSLLLGKAFRLKKEYDKAASYYKEGLEIANSLNDLEMQLTIKLDIAKLLEAKGDFEKAFNAYENTRNKAKANNLDAIYYEGSLLLAKYYYKHEHYDAALIGLSTAYINAIDSENLEFQKELLQIQARIFSKQKDYPNAYAVMTQLFGVTRKINSKQQREIIKELEIQYETLEKEKEISKLEESQIKREAELERQKTIKYAFLIGFLIILIPVIALLYTYYQKIQTQSLLSKKQEEINQQKVTTLKQEQELNLIKASMEGQDEERKRIAQELHDSIGGNLAGIKLQLSSIDNKPKELNTITTQLDETYQLVRDISHTLIPKKFRQNVFTNLIGEYAKTISNTGKIEVDFYPHPEELINTIPDQIQSELFKIIQELMTNTLKHAKATKVDIHLNYFEDKLSLLFEDNGQGFNTTESSEGIGFKNIKGRITELSGSLHIDSTLKRGTIIAIEIPNTHNNEL